MILASCSFLHSFLTHVPQILRSAHEAYNVINAKIPDLRLPAPPMATWHMFGRHPRLQLTTNAYIHGLHRTVPPRHFPTTFVAPTTFSGAFSSHLSLPWLRFCLAPSRILTYAHLRSFAPCLASHGVLSTAQMRARGLHTRNLHSRTQHIAQYQS